MNYSTVHVNTTVPYDVIIGDGILGCAGEFIKSVVKPTSIMLVTDDNVNSLYGEAALTTLERAGFTVYKHVIDHGEDSKNPKVLFEILEDACERHLTRRDVFIALGGGVVGDITGFAASVYMRGVDFIQIPTTLLSAVDASVGGKTAVDLKHGKNLAGTFWQPRMVICDSQIIRDLPSDIFGNGMAEVIKHGVIGDEAILELIDKSDAVSDNLDWLITRNVEIKRDVVEADEREQGSRRILNFGHTVAHAIEKTSDYTIPHGIAVGTGMVYETKLAERLGICEKGLADRIEGCCRKYGLFVQQDIDSNFIDAMKLDKKNESEKIVFALPEKIGAFRIVKLDLSDMPTLFKHIC